MFKIVNILACQIIYLLLTSQLISPYCISLPVIFAPRSLRGLKYFGDNYHWI